MPYACRWRHGFVIVQPPSEVKRAFCFSHNIHAQKVAQSCCFDLGRAMCCMTTIRCSPGLSTVWKWRVVVSLRRQWIPYRSIDIRKTSVVRTGPAKPCGRVQDDARVELYACLYVEELP